MSHCASHWLADIPADLMTHGAFRVMFHLCDAHNSQRSPETACFPSQAFLMKATGLSNSGLNKILNELEKGGFLSRRRTRNRDGTKGPTYYILGCDADKAQPTPLSGVGLKGEQGEGISSTRGVDKAVDKSVGAKPSNSTRGHKPTPLEGTNQLHRSGDKPVKEPLNEPKARAASIDPLFSAADLILTGKRFLCSGISAAKARACIEAGMVSIGDCRAVGIPI